MISLSNLIAYKRAQYFELQKKLHTRHAKGQANGILNVSYEVRTPDGKIRPQWQNNLLGRFILYIIRQFVKNPRQADGITPKTDFWSQLAIFGVRLAFVTGVWTTSALKIHNGVPTVGKALAASRYNGAGAEAAATYIALGTGTNAFAAGDTALQTELSTGGASRANATASRVTTTTTNDTARLQYTFSITSTLAITESGIFNAASTGTLGARQTFSAVNVVNGDSLQVTWDVKFA